MEVILYGGLIDCSSATVKSTKLQSIGSVEMRSDNNNNVNTNVITLAVSGTPSSGSLNVKNVSNTTVASISNTGVSTCSSLSSGGNITCSNATSTTITANKLLTHEQDGDTWGTTYFRLSEGNPSYGATLQSTHTTANIVDLAC